jgi:hypothetical protein
MLRAGFFCIVTAWLLVVAPVASAAGPAPCEKHIQPHMLAIASLPLDSTCHPSGPILLSFIVQVDGSVSNVKVVKSNQACFNGSAIWIVSQFKFDPRSSPCQAQYTLFKPHS